MSRRSVLTGETDDCAPEEGLASRIKPRQRRSCAAALLWAVLLSLAIAFVGMCFAPKVHAQAFNPVNDSLSVIVEVRNFEADSAQILVGYNGVIKTLGWVKGGTRRIFTLPSATLGTIPHLVVGAKRSDGETRKIPMVVPRGAWCVLIIGAPPGTQNAGGPE